MVACHIRHTWLGSDRIPLGPEGDHTRDLGRTLRSGDSHALQACSNREVVDGVAVVKGLAAEAALEEAHSGLPRQLGLRCAWYWRAWLRLLGQCR